MCSCIRAEAFERESNLRVEQERRLAERVGFGLHVLLILKNLADFDTFQNRQIRSNAGVETRIEHAASAPAK